MTEQIKDSMETCRIIVHAFEEELLNQRRYNDAKEIEVALKDMLKAFRSLDVWSEVLNELEELAMQHLENGESESYADVSVCIDHIKIHLQKLSEIKE